MKSNKNVFYEIVYKCEFLITDGGLVSSLFSLKLENIIRKIEEQVILIFFNGNKAKASVLFEYW